MNLANLASTKAGRRVYLNRSLVDADQLIVVGRFHYDPMLGYAGGLSDLFPALSDDGDVVSEAFQPLLNVLGLKAFVFHHQDAHLVHAPSLEE